MDHNSKKENHSPEGSWDARIHLPEVIWIDIKNMALAPYWKRKYNQSVQALPRFKKIIGSGIKIVFTSATKSTRFIKFIYRIDDEAAGNPNRRCIVTYMCVPCDLEEDPTWDRQLPESALSHFASTEYKSVVSM